MENDDLIKRIPIKDIPLIDLMNLFYENKQLKEENAELRQLLFEWDSLIKYQYHGSKEAMADLHDAGQKTAKKLYGSTQYYPKPKEGNVT